MFRERVCIQLAHTDFAALYMYYIPLITNTRYTYEDPCTYSHNIACHTCMHKQAETVTVFYIFTCRKSATLTVTCNAVRGLRLEHILAAADLNTLQHQLAKKDVHGTPFLLQPLTAAPHLVEGEPNARLLQLANLLTKGAQLNGSAKAAAVAANTIQQMMIVSICRGFTSAEGQETTFTSIMTCGIAFKLVI